MLSPGAVGLLTLAAGISAPLLSKLRMVFEQQVFGENQAVGFFIIYTQ